MSEASVTVAEITGLFYWFTLLFLSKERKVSGKNAGSNQWAK